MGFLLSFEYIKLNMVYALILVMNVNTLGTDLFVLKLD